MKKYMIVLKVQNISTGEIRFRDWMRFNNEPSTEEILKVKKEYEDQIANEYNELVFYAKVNCIYV
jgi:hypothetical protein